LAGLPSERTGIEFTNDYRPASWIHIDADLALTRARFLGYDHAHAQLYRSLAGFPQAQIGNVMFSTRLGWWPQRASRWASRLVADIVKQCWGCPLSVTLNSDGKVGAACRRSAAAPWWKGTDKFRENRDRLFVGTIEPINTYAGSPPPMRSAGVTSIHRAEYRLRACSDMYFRSGAVFVMFASYFTVPKHTADVNANRICLADSVTP
jgi:hypothetical protein